VCTGAEAWFLGKNPMHDHQYPDRPARDLRKNTDQGNGATLGFEKQLWEPAGPLLSKLVSGEMRGEGSGRFLEKCGL